MYGVSLRVVNRSSAPSTGSPIGPVAKRVHRAPNGGRLAPMADILSQDELDALLGQMKGDDDDEGDEPGPDPFVEVSAGGLEEEVPQTIAEAVATTAAEAEVPLDADLADDEELAWDAVDQADVNVQMILDIPVQVNVELGRSRLTIGDLLALGQGSVIELDHLASDMLDLTVNKKIVAQGEAVVINENFGVRVLEVDSVRDRIRKL